jgi:hypothetical protein
MPADIYSDRFYSLRVPAWHRLGIVSEEEHSASQALDLLDAPGYTLAPVYAMPPLTHTPGGPVILPQPKPMQLGNRAILRFPDTEGGDFVTMGLVGSEYELVPPAQVVEAWDTTVAKHVETMGFLGKGELFFLTTKMDSIDVRGEEVERYLGVVAPMDGGRSASVEEWDLRVVCANTLAIAQAGANNIYRVRHDEGAMERLGDWLSDMYGQLQDRRELVRDQYQTLASVRVTTQSALPTSNPVNQVLAAAYPEPRRPREDAPAPVVALRTREWERRRDRSLVFREAAMRLFQGEGTGMDSPAAAGTLWGLYNSVVELEDYRRGHNRAGQESRIAAQDAMFGYRQEVKTRALNKALELAR